MQWLDSLPTWALALLVVGGFTFVALLGFVVVRRFRFHAPDPSSDAMLSTFAVSAATLLGVLLVFVIVALYQGYAEAKDSVRAEATALAQLVRDGRAFPVPVESTIECRISSYRTTLIDDEWPAMARGTSSPLALARLEHLYAAVVNYHPQTPNERIFYRDAVSHLDDLISARRDRLDHVGGAVPGPLWILIVVAAFVSVLSMYAFARSADRLQVLLIGLYSVLIGASLFVAILLDFPFAGSIAVTPTPYNEGVLSHLCGELACRSC